MKKILLPTDFSDNSINAIHYALEIFKDINCSFYLLNIYGVPYLTEQELTNFDRVNLVKLEEGLFKSSQENLEKFLKKVIKVPNPNHKFKTISDYNFFINSVKQIVKNKNIELIVMGTKGATGAKEIFMGSNTGDLIMKTNCNLLAVPENATYKKPKEITFTTDFKIPYKKEDLFELIEIAKLHEAKIRVLHLVDGQTLDEEQRINKKALNQFFENLSYSFHTLTNTNFETAINCFTQSRGDIDMIAIIAKQYNFFQRLFFKPKVEELSFHTKIPLLVLHKTK